MFTGKDFGKSPCVIDGSTMGAIGTHEMLGIKVCFTDGAFVPSNNGGLVGIMVDVVTAEVGAEVAAIGEFVLVIELMELVGLKVGLTIGSSLSFISSGTPLGSETLSLPTPKITPTQMPIMQSKKKIFIGIINRLENTRPQQITMSFPTTLL
mmetsp:Transcript_32559/g.37724  ORF Transcript_32559/g.37724 Transcript_32559/m.37724 type:complete len:152 (-) Transcript_32559:104-559(-)